MPDDKVLKKRITDNIVYLFSKQSSNGSFTSFSFTEVTDRDTTSYQSVFFTALILSSLANLQETAVIKKIEQKAARFLLTQKSKFWSFNYWMRNSAEAKAMPYPDDLDDTFCVLAALFHTNPQIIDANAMGHIVTLLTTTEVEEGGPYRTWLVGEAAQKQWLDIDLAVNSNIAYFLFLQGIQLPKLDMFIEEHLEQEHFSSRYYPTSYPIIYFLSRWYQGPLVSKIKQSLLVQRKPDSSWGNPLDTALALVALFYLGTSVTDVAESIAFLLKQDYQKSYPFCFDPSRNGTQYVAGSPTLTTAFCLEALTLYLDQKRKQTIVQKKVSKEDRLYTQIMQQIELRFAAFPPAFAKEASIFARTIDKKVVLLPYAFSHSLHQKTQITDNSISLGVANVFGWIAYTIYDDFFDDEGDPLKLSLANVCLRELTQIFLTFLPENKQFIALFTKTLDRIDAANRWEVVNCRIALVKGQVLLRDLVLPDFRAYEPIYQKSFGHALGPLAILFAQGYSNRSSEVKNVTLFFQQYLIAKQLNDDAHDVFEDLQKGHCSPVVALLLNDFQKKYPNRKQVSPQSTLLKKLFWQITIETASKEILTAVKNARAAILKIHSICDSSFFETLLTPLEDAANKAITERNQVQTFLSAYKTNVF